MAQVEGPECLVLPQSPGPAIEGSRPGRMAALRSSAGESSRSSIRDERHDRMDKKNDHSRKQGQRYSFIDARAANHCYDFHLSPSRRQYESRPFVTLRCFGERGVKDRRYRLRGSSGRLAMFADFGRPLRNLPTFSPFCFQMRMDMRVEEFRRRAAECEQQFAGPRRVEPIRSPSATTPTGECHLLTHTPHVRFLGCCLKRVTIRLDLREIARGRCHEG